MAITIARERFLDADGVPVFIREYGEGEPVVLLHGFPQTGRCWHEVATRLAEHHHVIVPDLPGYGRSGRPTAYDARTLARTLVGAFDAAGLEQVPVVGHDWGGALTYRLALDHPQRVPKIAVINSPFRSLDLKRGWHMLFFNLPIVPEVLFGVAGGRIIDLLLDAGAARKDAFTPEARAEYHEAYASLERQRSAFAYYRTMTRQIIARALPLPGGKPSGEPKRIEQPTLLIWGMKDPVMPPSVLDSIVRDIPQARVEQIHDAGHFVPEERPERVAELLRDYLA